MDMSAASNVESSSSRSSSVQTAAEAAAKAARWNAPLSPSPKARRQRRSDPNRARTQRNAELSALRREAEELGAFLAKLKAKGPRCRRSRAVRTLKAAEYGGNGCNRGGAEVWREICSDQVAQKARAERENFRLRRAVDEYTELARSLHRAIIKSAHSLEEQKKADSARSKNRVYDIPIELDEDEPLFQSMIQELDASIRRIDELLELYGQGHSESEPSSGVHIRESTKGRSLDIYLQGFLPFDTAATADVVWEFFKSSAKHLGPLYFKRSKAVDASNDIVVENYAIELFANSMRADFRYRLVIRRYVQANRILISSLSFVEPVELANKAFTRCGFQSESYIILEPVASTPGMPFTRFRRCQRFSPYLASHLDDDALDQARQDFGAIIEFLLSLDIAKVHLQQFQNELLRRSLRLEPDPRCS